MEINVIECLYKQENNILKEKKLPQIFVQLKLC